MKKVKFLLLFFTLSFLFFGKVSASVIQTDFLVGDKYVVDGDLCESENDTVIVTKEGTSCVIEFVKVGAYSVTLTAPTEISGGSVGANIICGNVLNSKYDVTVRQLVDYVNDPNNRFAAAISQLMMQKDYKPASATKYTFAASLNSDGSMLYRFGYDTDIVEITLHFNINNNDLNYDFVSMSEGATSAPATEYTSTRYTTGLSALFFFMVEHSPGGDIVLDILTDSEKYAYVHDDMNSIQSKYMTLNSNVVDSTNYDFFFRLVLSNKVNEDIISLYNLRVGGMNGTESAPEDEIVNPETGLFISILIIVFMGIVSLIIMNINKNCVYRI